MPKSQSTFETPNASKYLQQLCKHFGHKITVEFTPLAGSIAFDFGTCMLSADETVLVVTADAADAETLARLENVIGSHLLRFAFREPTELVWKAL